MNYVFVASLLLIFLIILWMPASAVCLFLRGMRVPRPFAGLAPVWLAQLLVAAALGYATDRAGLGHPAGYALAICMACSVVGAFWLWSRRFRTS